MYRPRAGQHLIVLNLYSVLIKKILVTEFITVDVKYINAVKPSSTKQPNRAQDIRSNICKYKYNQVRLVLTVFASTCLY